MNNRIQIRNGTIDFLTFTRDCKENEFDEKSTCANFEQVADNGKTYNYKFYSLSEIIAVGYRINTVK